MNKTDHLTVRFNSELKRQGKELLNKLGFTHTDFVYMAYKQLVKEQKLPFKTPNNPDEFPKVKNDTLAVRFDTNLKKDGAKVLDGLEMTNSGFLRMAYRKLLEEQKIPFEI